MSFVDLFVAGVIALSVVIGLFRGLVREAVSLATWVAAVWIALGYAAPLAARLPFQLGSATVQGAVAGLLLFMAVLLAGGILNYLIGGLVDGSGLSGVDRLLGAVFGVARGVLVVSLMVLLATLTNMPHEDWWQQSVTLPWFHDIALWIRGLLPPELAQHFG